MIGRSLPTADGDTQDPPTEGFRNRTLARSGTNAIATEFVEAGRRNRAGGIRA